MIKSAQTKQVIFALGDEEYGLDIMIVNAIENTPILSEFPMDQNV